LYGGYFLRMYCRTALRVLWGRQGSKMDAVSSARLIVDAYRGDTYTQADI